MPAPIKSLGRIPLTDPEIVFRALWCEGKISYSLKNSGGRDPRWPLPARPGTRTADCIGFALWCFGIDRFQVNYPFYGGWINTDSMIMDVTGGRTHFTPLLENKFPHMIVVGSKKVFGHGPNMGHIGIVLSAGEVIHCNGSHNGVSRGRETWWLNWPKYYRVVPREQFPTTKPPPPIPRSIVSG